MTDFFLPTGAVRPTGWLARQLDLQADGLSGRLDQLWDDLKNSAWRGGSADGWERLPYWLDGFIPLAFLSGRADLQDRARLTVEALLAQQKPDGWLAPGPDADRGRYDVWAVFLVLKVFKEWHDATGDDRVAQAADRALEQLERHIETNPLADWGQMRWFEVLVALLWRAESTGKNRWRPLYAKLRAQGFDWPGYFGADWPGALPNPRGWDFCNHVVNNAMALKQGLLQALWEDRPDRAEAGRRLYGKLVGAHGTAWGLFTGDECLAGPSPTQGTELCAVVEAMYSLEWLAGPGRERWAGEALERIAYNALGAGITADGWYHQYVQQVNQSSCDTFEPPPWHDNGPEANLWGIEPHFGCCTANYHQGWPKFVRSLVVGTTEGLRIAAWAPCRVETRVAGQRAVVEVITDYPFRDRITVRAEGRFVLEFPVPSWSSATDAGATRKLLVKGREEWTMEWTAPARWEPRPGGRAVLSRGPLLFALPHEGRWHRCGAPAPEAWTDPADEPRPFDGLPFAHELPPGKVDWQFRVLPAAPAPAGGPDVRMAVRRREHDLPALPFDRRNPAVTCEVLWTEGPPRHLVPYAQTTLRTTEFS